MSNLHPTWQKALSHAITNIDDLCRVLHIDPQAIQSTHAAEKSFALRVPREFITRMETGKPNDPLLLQVLPQAIEMQAVPGFSNDPLKENLKNPIPGLLHKYHGRVL